MEPETVVVAEEVVTPGPEPVASVKRGRKKVDVEVRVSVRLIL